MRVTMLEDRQVTVDGVNTIDAAAGETYEMGDGVAQSLIDNGAAKDADDESAAAKPARGRRGKKAEPGADENKDADDESAAAKPARGRRGKKAEPGADENKDAEGELEHETE